MFIKSESQRIGAVDVAIRLLEVNYSKNNTKCSLKFEVVQQDGSGHSSYDDCDSDY
ncbi:hypothetical protein BYT27DRAFT_7196049 [Phlegmacium glaucopus]|nr:hypothetical protein BYT27DRAFT_7196049 [Phlegmacium glaucopus]